MAGLLLVAGGAAIGVLMHWIVPGLGLLLAVLVGASLGTVILVGLRLLDAADEARGPQLPGNLP